MRTARGWRVKEIGAVERRMAAFLDRGFASLPERAVVQFRLEPRGRRATGRLSAPFFRYSFISFRFSSSSVLID